MQIIYQRAIPELDGGVDPGCLTAQEFEPLSCEQVAINEHAPRPSPVPAEKESDEARLARARRADYCDVAACLDAQA